MFGTTRDDDAELRRNDIQPLEDILANAMQATATGADQAFRFDNLLHARKMSGKRTAVGGTGFRLRLPRGAIGFIFGMDGSNGRFQVLQCEIELLGIGLLGFTPKAACLKAATSFSRRSIRSSLRTSRSCAAISIAFGAAMSSGRSAASNTPKIYQTPLPSARRIHRPGHHAASIR